MNNAAKVVGGICLCLCMAFPLHAQLAKEIRSSPGQCCLPMFASRIVDAMEDWNQLGRYHEANLQIEKMPVEKGRVVFMGDSITDGWELAKYFPGKPYVNRGISGQTTPQMLARMYPDVVRLHPAAVIILAGTNDIARNTGPETLEMVTDNFRAMSELAAGHGIKVILCLLTPISDYTKSKRTTDRPPEDILSLNHWLESYARDIHAEVANYYTPLVDDKGMLREGYSDDGLHPNARGYELMAPIAEAAIEKVLK